MKYTKTSSCGLTAGSHRQAKDAAILMPFGYKPQHDTKWVKFLVVALLAMAIFNMPAFAQSDEAVAEAPADPTYDERIELAKKMHELRPVRDQVEQAINRFAQTRPQGERESFKSAMRNVFNMRALEKISTDAYAETFTVKELQAMVEYYSKPEAISASEKFDNYAGIVYPEIVRMLDRAAIRVRTGE